MIHRPDPVTRAEEGHEVHAPANLVRFGPCHRTRPGERPAVDRPLYDILKLVG